MHSIQRGQTVTEPLAVASGCRLCKDLATLNAKHSAATRDRAVAQP